MGSLPQAWGRWKREWPFWRVTGSRVHNFKGVSKKGVSISICISKGKVSTPHLVKNSTLQNHMSRHLQNVIASKVIPDRAYKLLTPAGRGPEGRTRPRAKVGPRGIGMQTAESISFSAFFAFIAFLLFYEHDSFHNKKNKYSKIDSFAKLTTFLLPLARLLLFSATKQGR